MPQVRRRARIEIIPLIDIIFFLLATFVMVSLSMVKMQGIKVNLPTATTSVSQEDPGFVTVTITEHGGFFFNKQVMSLNQLVMQLKDLKLTQPDVTVIINGDKQAFFGDAIGLLDEVRRMGIQKVTIQTENITSTEPKGGQ
jgi:biopolymer transport protein ExbD